jgi:hypothetical protein
MTEKTSFVAVLLHAVIFGAALYTFKTYSEGFQNGILQTVMSSNPNNLNQKKEGFQSWSNMQTKFNLMVAAWTFIIFWYIDFGLFHLSERIPFGDILITVLFPITSIGLAIGGFVHPEK